MVLAYFIYTVIPIVVILLTFLGVRHSKNNQATKETWFFWGGAILFYTLIIGLRENVGIDYTSYKIIIQNLIYKLDYGRRQDIIFYLFVPIVKVTHYNVFIVFLAFITILYQFLILSDKCQIATTFMVVFFISMIFFLSLNIMRQNAALFVVFYSMILFQKKQYLKSAIHFAISFIIHKSIFVLIPFYFLFYKNIIISIPVFIQFALVITSFFLGDNIYNFFEHYIKIIGLSATKKIPFLSGYSPYLENFEYWAERGLDLRDKVKGTGVSKYVFLCLSLFSIGLSVQLKNFFRLENFSSYYPLLIIGEILKPVFFNSEFLSRITSVFIFFKVYVYTTTIFYLFNIYKGRHGDGLRFIMLTLILMLIIFYYVVIYKQRMAIAPFQFLSF